MSITVNLSKAGLTNSQSEDISAYTAYRGFDNEAWCNSSKCAGRDARKVRSKGVLKDKIPFTAVMCRDCGCALQWRVKPKSYRAVEGWR
jgi:hypothetical protein